MIALHRALNQPRNDIIAIAIETGIQNTGMSIFILWFTLDHPLGDITGEYLKKCHLKRVFRPVVISQNC